MAGQDDLESFAWRELVAHLREHAEVQNIDLMNLAGFCRNCLSKWLFLGAHRLGRRMEYDEAVFAVYGMTIKDWKARHQTEATPEALKRFKEGQSRHAKIDVDTKQPAQGSAGVAAATPAPAPVSSNVCCRSIEELTKGTAPAEAVVGALATIRVAVLTVSDRASRGQYADQSGPEIQRLLAESTGAHYIIAATAVVPDERGQIESRVREWADSGTCDLVLTTGGTGLAPRDVTPEATETVCDRSVPGLSEAVRSLCASIEPMAWLSRATAGIRGRTLVVNLPGRPKAVQEALAGVLLRLLPHAVSEATGQNQAGAPRQVPVGVSDVALQAFAWRELV
eukprot:Hpha_TRINITY_DN11112_c0_g1::TRINITY_DN11112_c0_g1_i1::g.28081::m.28081